MNRSTLQVRIYEQLAAGKRPIKVNAYGAGPSFAAVFVNDGLADPKMRIDLTSDEYLEVWTTHRDAGLGEVG